MAARGGPRGGPGAMAEPALLREYVSHLAARAAQGQLAACADPALKARARRLLGPGRRGALDVRGVAECCRRARGGRALRDLLKALELLELLCVNLLLCPWRREIRSLKTFTGNFVYYIQPVLPEDIVKAVLEKIGYVATTATEFSLVKKRNNEETKQTAFEIFLARIECEAILEMADEGAHGSLEERLQQGTQTRQHGGEEDEEHHTPQRGDTGSLGDKGSSETPLCLVPQQKGSVPCAASRGAAGGVRIPGDGAQSAAAASPSSLQRPQRQSTDTLPGKGWDSEDFLSRYSDIVIAQTPIFGESLSPRARGLAEERASARPPGALSPGASGPPAFAMFADSARDSKATLEFEAPGVPEGSIEAEINDAINCIDPAPGDEPSELKSLPYKDFARNCGVPGEEDICELSLTFTELQIKDAQEELMYPVEESGQPGAGTSDRHVRECSCSQIKHTYLPDADLHKRAASHPEPPSGLCCTAGHTEDATAASDSRRLFLDPAKGHPASECFRQVREPPCLTYIPPQSMDVQPCQGQPAGACAGGRGGRLEHSTCQETEGQEPYVIIDSTEQAALSQHT
ncbi:spermatogenesis-associated protein 2-like protein [Melospiza melodia melodia]|uniref:spermatogenesis-associated protein 2-like protein n=1 Tax=Melospiza melodia melodia TaxID=1914991 RepID=UPI002FD0A891